MFEKVGGNGQDSILDDTWHADHGLMHLINLPIEPVPEYACVLTELAIYHTGFPTYSSFALIMNNLVGPLEEHLSLSDIDAAWPRRLNGSEIYKLTLGFGTFVSIDSEIWDMWGTSVHDLTLGGEHTSLAINI